MVSPSIVCPDITAGRAIKLAGISEALTRSASGMGLPGDVVKSPDGVNRKHSGTFTRAALGARRAGTDDLEGVAPTRAVTAGRAGLPTHARGQEASMLEQAGEALGDNRVMVRLVRVVQCQLRGQNAATENAEAQHQRTRCYWQHQLMDCEAAFAFLDDVAIVGLSALPRKTECGSAYSEVRMCNAAGEEPLAVDDLGAAPLSLFPLLEITSRPR